MVLPEPKQDLYIRACECISVNISDYGLNNCTVQLLIVEKGPQFNTGEIENRRQTD